MYARSSVGTLSVGVPYLAYLDSSEFGVYSSLDVRVARLLLKADARRRRKKRGGGTGVRGSPPAFVFLGQDGDGASPTVDLASYTYLSI